jgi:hypothetical protein
MKITQEVTLTLRQIAEELAEQHTIEELTEFVRILMIHSGDDLVENVQAVINNQLDEIVWVKK